MRHPTGRRRLSAATLGEVRADLVPTYDRDAPATIVHLGVGGFVRAHLVVYADDLLRSGRPATIAGVSLRSPTAEEQLAPQDGLYTVVEREPGHADALRVVGSFGSVATGPAAAVEAIADPATRLVTLTVTEKGYEPEPAGRVGGAPPRSAPAVIARGLARRDRAAPAPTIASLDNLLGNGRRLRERVVEEADVLGPALARWIEDTVAFPCSVVDRMVPATTEVARAAIADELGLDDHAAVVAEQHCSWIAEDVDGLRAFADVGVQLVGDIEPYEHRKLWLLNGPHSTLAYLGLLAGRETIADATGDPAIAAFARCLVDDVLEVADLPAGLVPEAFAADALRRFENPALGHTCAQVGTDGSHKLAQRVLPVVTRRRRAGLPTDRFVVVLAAWLASVAGVPVQGRRLPAVDDPEAEPLQHLAADGDLHALAARALGDVGDPGLVADVAATLARLTEHGASVIDGR